MLFIIILYSIIILLKQKTPCITTEGLVTNRLLDKQIGFRFRVSLCGLHLYARGRPGNLQHSVALPTSHAKTHAYLAIAWETHIRPRSHPSLTVNEFGKTLLTAQVAFTYRVHDLTRHGPAFDLNVLHSVTFGSQVTGLRCIQFTIGS